MEASRRIASLLDTLCVELGFCLPPKEQDAITAEPPADVDLFVERVFRAEGLDPRSDRRLYAAVRERVAAVLETVRFMRVTWPDGSVIADVEVSPNCEPIRTTHVLGSFTRGPGFERLMPRLDEMNELSRDRDEEAAVGASARMDVMGIRATDEFGRVYDVFDVVFGQRGGFLFGAALVEPHST